MTTHTMPTTNNQDHLSTMDGSPDDNQNSPTQNSGQVLINIQHGGHAVEKESTTATLAAAGADVTLVNKAVLRMASTQAAVRAAPAQEDVFKTRFDYLLSKLKDNPAARLPEDDPDAVVTGLKALGDAMVEHSLASGEDALQPTGNSTIPAVYTYWGQFIDHDLTANTDRDSDVSNITQPNLKPIPPNQVVEELNNLRQPTLNLDSLYGDGPTFDPSQPTEARGMYNGIKFRLGQTALNPPLPAPQTIPGAPIPPDRRDTTVSPPVFVAVDQDRDLPRIGELINAGVLKETDFPDDLRAKANFKQLAFIADARNDENLIVAQLHVAFLRFHNNVVKWVQEQEPSATWSEKQIFTRAQQLTRWHYQWLVVNDYLKTVTLAGIVDKVLLGGAHHYQPQSEPFMPLEFSVAAFRFGHTMVRANYDYNRNFGRPGNVFPVATFDLLFTFTGSGFLRNPATGEIILRPFLGGSDVLPFNWLIEWDRFLDKGSAIPDHFARKIDTMLAPPLRDMMNQGNEISHTLPIKQILKRLARRNLLRAYHLSIPTGQSVAAEMEVPVLSETELKIGNSGPLNQVLEDHNFLKQTPLWYYILKEAEVKANGNSLGELGSRIICETIIGQLLHDPTSYLKQRSWNPGKGVKLSNGDPIVTIRDFIQFAGLLA